MQTFAQRCRALGHNARRLGKAFENAEGLERGGFVVVRVGADRTGTSAVSFAAVIFTVSANARVRGMIGASNTKGCTVERVSISPRSCKASCTG
jgi:hypothetical protein